MQTSGQAAPSKPRSIKIRLPDVNPQPPRQPLRNISNIRNQTLKLTTPSPITKISSIPEYQGTQQTNKADSSRHRVNAVIGSASVATLASTGRQQPGKFISLNNSPENSLLVSQAYSNYSGNSVYYHEGPPNFSALWYSTEVVCKNHSDKQAKFVVLSEDGTSHVLEDQSTALYYCAKCAVVLASQGFKVSQIDQQPNQFKKSHKFNRNQSCVQLQGSDSSTNLSKRRLIGGTQQNRLGREARSMLLEMKSFLQTSSRKRESINQHKLSVSAHHEELIEAITSTEEYLVDYVRNTAKAHRQEVRRLGMDFHLECKHRLAQLDQASQAINNLAVDIENCLDSIHKINESKFDQVMSVYRDQLQRARIQLDGTQLSKPAEMQFDVSKLSDIKALIEECFQQPQQDRHSQKQKSYLEAMQKYQQRQSVVQPFARSSPDALSEQQSQNDMFFSFEHYGNTAESSNQLEMSSIKKDNRGFDGIHKKGGVEIKITLSDEKQNVCQTSQSIQEQSIVDEDFRQMFKNCGGEIQPNGQFNQC